MQLMEEQMSQLQNPTPSHSADVSMQGWFGLAALAAVILQAVVSIWALTSLPSGTCITMQWNLNGSPAWCASKLLASAILPSITLIYAVRGYFSFTRDAEPSLGALVGRLLGLGVLTGLHAFLLLRAG